MSTSVLRGVNPPRLCAIRKRPDFQGYGFNLQAEKGKPGQFIGNVDPGSPAEMSGVKKFDRVIEVNGVNVCNEGHKQVVARIKEVPDEVILLLMDPEAERRYLENGIVVKSQMDFVERHGEHPASNGSDDGHEVASYDLHHAPTDNGDEVHATVIAVEEAEAAEVVNEESGEASESRNEEAAVIDGLEKLTTDESERPVSENEEDGKRSEEAVSDSQEAAQESGSYDVTSANERLAEDNDAHEEVKEEEEEEEEKEEEKIPEPQVAEEPVNGSDDSRVKEVTPAVSAETLESNYTRSNQAPMNGNTSQNAFESVFKKSASEVRAAQSRSKRRAIKETNQTFREKFMVFENL